MTSDSDLTPDEDAVLACLPSDGSTKGNKAVLLQLGWDEDRYYAARNSLVDRGYIRRGQGRGGTVRRNVVPSAPGPSVLVTPSSSAVPSPTEIEEAIRSEIDLYAPMRDVIAGDWAKDHRADPVAVEITAQQGRRATGGMWSRPDITSVEVRTFAYVPGKYIEVVTFEIKPQNSINVQAVYEALAHRRAATRSYVLLHVPADLENQLVDQISDVASVARSHGIGLVTAEEPSDYSTWDERVAAERYEPDPERLDEFIATQLSEAARSRISRRLR